MSLGFLTCKRGVTTRAVVTGEKILTKVLHFDLPPCPHVKVFKYLPQDVCKCVNICSPRMTMKLCVYIDCSARNSQECKPLPHKRTFWQQKVHFPFSPIPGPGGAWRS